MANQRGATRMIGQTLGHYRIVEKLGEGGMGVVYRAQDTQPTTTVTIKLLPEDPAQGSKAGWAHRPDFGGRYNFKV